MWLAITRRRVRGKKKLRKKKRRRRNRLTHAAPHHTYHTGQTSKPRNSQRLRDKARRGAGQRNKQLFGVSSLQVQYSATCPTGIKDIFHLLRLVLLLTIPLGPPYLQAWDTVPCTLETCTLYHVRATATTSHPEATLPRSMLLAFPRPPGPTRSFKTQDHSPRIETAADRADRRWTPHQGLLSS